MVVRKPECADQMEPSPRPVIDRVQVMKHAASRCCRMEDNKCDKCGTSRIPGKFLWTRGRLFVGSTGLE